MRFVFYHIFCLLLLTAIFTGNTFGQIFRVNADTVVVMSAGNTDSIHVFYGNSIDSLLARSPVAGPATFEWSQYDTTISKQDFSIPLPYTDSIVSNLPSGGYQVHITASGKDYYYVAWVFIDKLSVNIIKDSNGDNSYLWYTCEYTDFRATSSQSNFIYYDSNKKKQTLTSPTFYWSSDHPIKNAQLYITNWLRMDTTKGMPYEKAVYRAFVKDKFGATSKMDSVKYSPIVCKAKIEKTDEHPFVGDSIPSAPFTVTFLNKSLNAVKYTWKFAEKDTVKRNDTSRVVRTFYETAPYDSTAYKVYLISQSLEKCVDTTSVTIKVHQGEIGDSKSKDNPWPDLPNYFCPESEKYPVFKIYNVSIRQFKFTVFSRWGKKVYEAEGPNMLDWTGWDGNIGRSKASDGIYYYVLEVISWDQTPDQTRMNPKGKYSGFFYLFRQK